jgi:cholestenol Delta-isomerase
MADAIINLQDNVTKLAAEALHPYFPLDAEIIGYAANEWSVPALLGVFFGTCTCLFTATYFVAKSINANLRKGELSTIMWFVLSGSIHLFFEGYYAANYATLGSKQTLIGQMWKEYAFSDSRYLTRNTFVLCMETMTAVCWGPGCIAVAILIILRHPLRFPVQLIVSVGQFYGDALYYATSFFDHYVAGISYSRPEAFYYWFYFILMNLFWLVIPGSKLLRNAMVNAAVA